jgi:hypothetical protein
MNELDVGYFKGAIGTNDYSPKITTTYALALAPSLKVLPLYLIFHAWLLFGLITIIKTVLIIAINNNNLWQEHPYIFTDENSRDYVPPAAAAAAAASATDRKRQ